MPVVHQLGSSLTYGDAITNHILALDAQLRAWGVETHMYGEIVEARLQPPVQLDSAYVPFLDHPNDLLIYHYSAYSANLQLFHRSRNRKLLIYHNITPSEYFEAYDTDLATVCRLGRQAIPGLRDCDLALGVSAFNRDELLAAGFDPSRTGVLPILLDLTTWENTERNTRLYARLTENGATNILFVGRVSPNKAFEDVIKVFAAYRALNPHARLYLVGKRFLPRYNLALDRLVARLGLTESVVFTDRIELADLKAYYQAAHVFLCASRHEGLCVPLLESMYFGVPILAYAAAAIPDTFGSAGVLFNAFNYPVLAETLHLLATDAALRAPIIAGQRQRLAHFAPDRIASEFRDILRTFFPSLS